MTRPEPGRVERPLPGLRRVLAPNPGPMTHWGTNSFIVGEGRVAVIDPGPEDPDHLAALLSATRGETVTHILVTHPHRDHSPLAARLSVETGAPVLGFGPADAGQSDTMRRLAIQGLAGGGEGVDRDFAPDQTIGEGARIEGDGWVLEVCHTPGHFSGHLGFRFADTMISGDHVMDWASSLVSPPDGDLRAFMETTRRLAAMPLSRLEPAHGHPIGDPADRLDWLLDHRMKRETAILDALSPTPQSVSVLTRAVYFDIEPAMHPAAERNVLAHLIDLVERNLATASPHLAHDAEFSRA